MKTYEVHRVRVSYMPNSSEKLRAQTEALLNEKARLGWEVVSIDFELADQGGYIYSFITLCR